MKFRKKPVVIEAYQWTTGDNTEAIPTWLVAAIACQTMFDSERGMFIRTLEGDMQVGEGDWIIQGVKGELYPCKPDIFALTYEPA
jgi:hypothetical protein